MGASPLLPHARHEQHRILVVGSYHFGGAIVSNAMHLHLRRYGMTAIARRHPRLFARLINR
jgi:hypothetical protein